PRFPIVLETYRELLEDVLPLGGLQQFLTMVDAGDAGFSLRRDRHPSPLSNTMLLDFTAAYLYLEDRPVGRNRSNAELRDDLGTLLGNRVQAETVLDEQAVATMEERLQGIASFHRARNGAELVELLRRIGDLTESELIQRCHPEAGQALPDLISDGRIIRIQFAGSSDVHRLAVGEEAELYDRLSDTDIHTLVARYVAHHALVTRKGIVDRYPPSEASLDRIRETEGWIDVEMADRSTGWSHPQVLASIRRMTMSRRRRSIEPVSAQAYARFTLARQYVTATATGEELDEVMDRLSGCRLPVPVWLDVLSVRVRGFRPEQLDDLIRDGALLWFGSLSQGNQRL
ncbi:hypothetical protein KAR02_03620, partial [Candidatus Bipolaricaulota bacterium]|nr:hypothetical protein [Candidatus Bipolaricaulota bacterium]